MIFFIFRDLEDRIFAQEVKNGTLHFFQPPKTIRIHHLEASQLWEAIDFFLENLRGGAEIAP